MYQRMAIAPDRGALGSTRRCAHADGVLRATSTEALDARAFPRIEMRTSQMRLAPWPFHNYDMPPATVNFAYWDADVVPPILER